MRQVKVVCPHGCGSTRAVVERVMLNVTRYRCVRCKRVFVARNIEQVAAPERSKEIKCYVKKHQNKEAAFIGSLSKMCRLVDDPKNAQVCLYDNDAVIGSDRFARFERSYPANRVYFVYPHSGRPSVIGDLYETSRLTSAHFVSARGHAEVMRAYGFEKPVVVTGWHLSPLLDFKSSSSNVPSVLFAPIHPRMSVVDKELNNATHAKLCALHRKKEIALTVRHIKRLEDAGIAQRCYGVSYYEGSQDSGYSHLLDYALVVAHQTVAYTAVALGVPTLMMGEWVKPHNFHGTGSRERLVYVKSWEKYRDLMMYPLDILATDDVLGLAHRAMTTDEDIRGWRERMIGKPFDPTIVARTIDEYTKRS